MRAVTPPIRRAITVTAALVAGWAPVTAARADVPGVRAILPVGEGASVSAVDLANYEATGAVPPSFTNQQAPFDALVADGPRMTDALIEKDFPAEPVALDGTAARVESPEAGVTIAWDSLGIPHISGQTADELMFGAGYAQAEARLFTMDVLRHLGSGTLTALVGPGAGDANLLADEAVRLQSDYSASERQAQVTALPSEYGTLGARAVEYDDAYTAGINARIAADRANPLLMPAEYAAVSATPQPWSAADSVAIAAEINNGFDLGGGAQAIDGEIIAELDRRLGSSTARRVFGDISFQNSALAPTTTAVPFPYPEPDRVAPSAVAPPDPASVQPITPIVPAGGSGAARDPAAVGRSWSSMIGASRLGRGGGESYAVLVGGTHSVSGRPIADMGPQLDFFSPEIVMEESLQGPGIAASGATLPGATPVPIVGHTNAFAWSVTIGVGQHVSIFALRLCNPDGSPPSRSSTSYVYRGRCVAMLQRSDAETTTTSVDNPAPAQTFTIRTLRSVYGPVVATGTVRGAPVAFARSDATYGHLADTALALAQMSDGAVSSPQSFITAARLAPFSLNWFYIDGRHIAWTLSGRYPVPRMVKLRIRVRRGRTRVVTAGPSPTEPIWGTGIWDWPGRLVSGPQIPHVIDPASGTISNWNNKPAPGWRASDDDYYFGPVHRVSMYRQRLAAAIAAGHGRIDEARLVSLVEDADTVDLRGSLVLPWVLRVLGPGTTPQTRELVALMRAWVAGGAHIRDLNGDGMDDAGAADRLMDAWWPLLVPAIFKPVLGPDAYGQATMSAFTPIDDAPPVDAEAWYDGWYGQVQQDMRDVLARHAIGHFSRVYCGGGPRRQGSLRSCRTLLLTTLATAAASVATAQGTADPTKWTLPATCPLPATGLPNCDEIVFAATGAIGTNPVPWQNRPTYQQVVAFP